MVDPVVIPAKVEALVVSKSSAEKSDTRRDWALLLLAGGGMAMTAFSAVALYLVAENDKYVFWLGMASMLQIFIVFTGLLGLLVKRSLKISKSEISIVDEDAYDEIPPSPEDLVKRRDVQSEITEAVQEVPAIGVPTSGSTDKQS